MSTVRNRPRLTYADYVELPEDGERHEILEGELVVTPAPTTRHQRVSANLEYLLMGHVRAFALGTVLHAPVDVILADDCIVQPDIVFVSAGREDIIKLRGVEDAPDLVVEILSDATARRDRTKKANLYARHGVPHYWLVDPDERTFETQERGKRRYRRTGLHASDVVVQSAPFAALRIPLGETWV